MYSFLGGDPDISELSVKQQVTHAGKILGAVFMRKFGQMIRPKTVSYLVDGYTPINNLWDGRKGEI